MDCKQLIKIERYVEEHLENGMATLQSAIDDVRQVQEDTGPRTRNDFNDTAKVLFNGWRAAAKVGRAAMANDILKEAQATGVVERLGSAAWSEKTVKDAMSNLLRHENKRARVAAAGAAAGPAEDA